MSRLFKLRVNNGVLEDVYRSYQKRFERKPHVSSPNAAWMKDVTHEKTVPAGNTIGILNRGKNNTFVNNTFIGSDVAIQDEGDGTRASSNKIIGSNVVERGRGRWFSMNNPVVYFLTVLVVTGFIAFLAFISYQYEWPLYFS